MMAQDEGAFWEGVEARLKPLLIQKNDPAAFAAPPAAELAALEAWGAAPKTELPADLAKAGWVLDVLPYAAESLWLLREARDARRGRGMVLLRPSKADARLALMVPHRFFDRLTSPVGRGAFFRSGAWVLIENTAHRHWGRIEGEEYGPGDVAHREATALHALTKGLLAGRKNLLLAQIHGFTGGAEAGEQVPEAFAIVSDGTREPGAAARTLAGKLKGAGLGALLYGPDTRRMGATENVQGRHIRAGKDARFLHIELSLPLREQLKADASVLADALRAAAD